MHYRNYWQCIWQHWPLKYYIVPKLFLYGDPSNLKMNLLFLARCLSSITVLIHQSFHIWSQLLYRKLFYNNKDLFFRNSQIWGSWCVQIRWWATPFFEICTWSLSVDVAEMNCCFIIFLSLTTSGDASAGNLIMWITRWFVTCYFLFLLSVISLNYAINQ